MDADIIDKIVALRKQRWAYQRIGEELKYSREYIRIVLKKHAPELVGAGKADHKRIPLVTRLCKRCNTGFDVLPAHKKLFCSRKCASLFRSGFPESNPYPHGDKRRSKWRYQMMKKYQPELLKKYHDTMKRNHKRKMLEDPEYRERFRQYHQRYYQLTKKNHG